MLEVNVKSHASVLRLCNRRRSKLMTSSLRKTLAAAAVLVCVPSVSRASDFTGLVSTLVAFFGVPTLLLSFSLAAFRNETARALMVLIGIMGWMMFFFVLGYHEVTQPAGLIYSAVLCLFSWVTWRYQISEWVFSEEVTEENRLDAKVARRVVTRRKKWR